MSEEPRTMIDDFLAEQRQLTAVEEFSRVHDAGNLVESRYRHLLPLSAPRPGEQYAFEVNLDQCSGCKGCVTACHSLNGLDDGETWRDTGLLLGEMLLPSLHGGNEVISLQQTVTTACHHCVEPACLEGCPVLAYDKDPVTGIVRHLDDQCIGCSYCILKCPYDVPKYSAKRGIVRKCDMCHGRLEAGEAPACVQACPNEAIKITVVQTAVVREASSAPWLSDAPSSCITLPTTRYTSNRPPAEMRSADHEGVRPQHAHWPLVLMLVFTQLGIGASIVTTWGNLAAAHSWAPYANLAAFAAGLFFSVFHLGQPLKAWRVWLGWRTSWLSREAILLNAFGAFLGWQIVGGKLPGWVLLCAAVFAVFAQVMVYADTKRQFWDVDRTLPRFFGSVFVLGAAFALVLEPSTGMALMLMAGMTLKLGCEVAILKYKDDENRNARQLHRTAILQLGLLRPILTLRVLCALTGGLFLPYVFVTGFAGTSLLLLAFGLCMIGEIAERFLFFASVAPDRMPGNQGS
jgi:formate dehydrogenase iron-sulfur subunit